MEEKTVTGIKVTGKTLQVKSHNVKYKIVSISMYRLYYLLTVKVKQEMAWRLIVCLRSAFGSNPVWDEKWLFFLSHFLQWLFPSKICDVFPMNFFPVNFLHSPKNMLALRELRTFVSPPNLTYSHPTFGQ